MAGMAPLGLPTLPSGVPTASGGNSLGMSYPGMPLMGPQMVLPSMAPDGTLMSPNGMHGYQAHMQPFPYMFPGMGHAGMQINPMQVTHHALRGTVQALTACPCPVCGMPAVRM